MSEFIKNQQAMAGDKLEELKKLKIDLKRDQELHENEIMKQ